MKGRDKIFEVRRIYNDVNVHRRVPDAGVRRAHQMYQFRKTRPADRRGPQVVTRDFHRIKQTLLFQMTNMGQPFLYVVDGNYLNRGELFLSHQFSRARGRRGQGRPRP
jgi:stage V sporulation protein R